MDVNDTIVRLDRSSKHASLLAMARIHRASLVREAGERPYRRMRTGPAPDSSRTPRLGGRARAAMRLKHLSPRAEDAYLGWMRRYYDFHGRKDPATLGATHLTAFLSSLATQRRIAASTQNQALAARTIACSMVSPVIP